MIGSINAIFSSAVEIFRVVMDMVLTVCLLFGLVMLGIGSFVFKKYQNEFIYHI